MKRWKLVTGVVALALLLFAGGGLAIKTRAAAHDLLTNPRATRHLPTRTPADLQLRYDDATVTTPDGLRLAGWFIPPAHGATIVFVHGYKDQRGAMLDAARLYAHYGYGVLLATVRAHDFSDGEQITFGHHEMQDLEAWYRYLRSRPDVDMTRVGILGVSMGGSLAIQYAAGNLQIRAVVADSAFSSLDDTVATSVKFFTGLPRFPFVPLIRFWVEREAGFSLSEIDAKRWIGRISPRPVFLMKGGADVVISPESGRLLYDAAGEPKELWFDPALGHTQFFDQRREEYERRVIGFWNRYLSR